MSSMTLGSFADMRHNYSVELLESVIEEFTNIEELCEAAEKLEACREAWVSVETVSKSLHSATKVYVDMVSEEYGIDITIPSFEMFSPDTRDYAITATTEGLGSAIMAILKKIATFISWLFDTIFKGHGKYKKGERVNKTLEEKLSAKAKRLLAEIDEINIEELKLTTYRGKVVAGSDESITKVARQVIKILSNVYNTALRFSVPTFNFQASSTTYDYFIKDYANMVNDYKTTMVTITSIVLEMVNIVIDPFFDEDHSLYDYDNKLAEVVNKLKELDNIHQVPRGVQPAGVVNHNTYGVAAGFGRPGDEDPNKEVYPQYIASVAKYPPGPMTGTYPDKNKPIFNNYTVTKTELPVKPNTYYVQIKKDIATTKGVKTVIGGLFASRVGDINKLQKSIDSLNKTSNDNGEQLKKALLKIKVLVDRDINRYNRGKTTSDPTLPRYRFLLGVLKTLTYWHLMKASNTKAINTNAKGFGETWVI